MGRPKAALEWHGSTLLHRTTALLARTVGGPVLVVAAPGQDLPELPPGVEVVADPVEGLGPMRGLATGLAALGERSPAAFVCSTDLPFLHPALIRRVLRGFADPGAWTSCCRWRAATGSRWPPATGRRWPGWWRSCWARGSLRPGMLFRHCRVAQLDDACAAGRARSGAARPGAGLAGQRQRARRLRGRPGPPGAGGGGRAVRGARRRRTAGTAPVRAASLGAAAAAVGIALDRHIVAAVNGDQMTRDARLPLVAGDTVAFLSADAGG